MSTKALNVNNNSNLPIGFPADRKKVFIAAALIAVMAFMWIRVLLNNKVGNEASASTIDDPAAQIDKKIIEKINIEYMKLPVIPGRNDILTNDFFASNNFRAFEFDPEKTQTRTTGNNTNVAGSSNIDIAVKAIKIDAIIAGQVSGNGEVFIDNKLLSQGSKLQMTHNGRSYEFEVMEIYETKVVLKFQDQLINIEMPTVE
jgi:hypothetical protein